MNKPEETRNEVELVDALTNLSNHRGFIAIGKPLIRRCNEYEKDVLLLLFDLNKLQSINETYGHAEGDKVLKLFAEQLFKNFRHSDAVARLEGDVFCVLCAGANKHQETNIINRFEKKLSSIHTPYPIEFSVSAVQYDRLKHFSLEMLIEEAESLRAEQKRIRDSS